MKIITKRQLTVAATLFAIVNIAPLKALAQGGCIEIRSILVDACGSPEGENEMVRFDVGSATLSTANMTVDWPNNPWQGLCQDASTAATVTAINQNIQGCGMLVEPASQVLPANAKVLLITSTNINTAANSFSNLNDTMVVLFQCAGNTSGHFANYNVSPGLRTLSIQFTGPAGCTDSVTYDRTLLVNQYGTIGGFSFENDGAVVEFTASGNASYTNYGCQALGTTLIVSAGPDIGLCPGAPQVANLQGSAAGNTGGVQWAGGTGILSNPTGLSTTYTPGPGETGIVYITLTGNGACGISKTDTARVNIVTSLPVPVINVNGSTLTSSITDSTYFYNWFLNGTEIPFQFGTSYTATANGCYQLVLSTVGGCESPSDTVCITNVGLEELGAGATVQLVSNPGSTPWLLLNPGTFNGKVDILITDISGRIIQSLVRELRGTPLEVHPDWNNKAPGIYLATVRTASHAVTLRLVIQQ
jgi:hypothetical protein